MTGPATDDGHQSPVHDDSTGGRSWGDYLNDFHNARPGITEQVLRHARYRGQDPYDWLIEQLPREGRVLDLAGGNGALTVRLPPAVTATLLDTSAAELTGARERGTRRLAQADAAILPVADGSIDAVACSMALMLVPLQRTLAEVRRVLKCGGLLVATLPASKPLTAADASRYGRLLFALRLAHLSYPNNRELADPGDAFAQAGLKMISDERRRFHYHIETAEMGRVLLRSLYLPGTTPPRLAAASRVAERWVGRELGVPIRRLIAVNA